jgi:hypothetical protein
VLWAVCRDDIEDIERGEVKLGDIGDAPETEE